MLNVVDQAQKTSFTRKELTSMGEFSINQQSQGVNFFGNARKNGYIPGYLFRVANEQGFRDLKNMLTRCIYEVQNHVKHNQSEDYDEDYLEQQLVADMANLDDIKMIDESMSDFDFDFKEADTKKKQAAQTKQINKLVSKMGHIDEASSSSQEMSREHKTDKNGNFRYFDSESDEE